MFADSFAQTALSHGRGTRVTIDIASMESAMKENTLGPRKWAFVVIAGGTVFSLPFMQSDGSKTTTDPLAQLDVSVPVPDKPTIATVGISNDSSSAVMARSQAIGAANDRLVIARDASKLLNEAPSMLVDIDKLAREPDEKNVEDKSSGPQLVAQSQEVAEPDDGLPDWARQSPFEKLKTEKAEVPEFPPPADLVPIQPMRPWIQGPLEASVDASVDANAANLSHLNRTPADASVARDAFAPITPPGSSVSHSFPSTSNVSVIGPSTTTTNTSPASVFAKGERANRISPSTAATPFSDEGPNMKVLASADADAKKSTTAPNPTMALGSHTARVDSWPDEHIDSQQLARKLAVPKRELQSAIVAPHEVMHPITPADLASTNTSAATSSVTTVSNGATVQPPALSRNPIKPAAPNAPNIRFGQPGGTPSRARINNEVPKQNMIFQPRS